MVVGCTWGLGFMLEGGILRRIDVGFCVDFHRIVVGFRRIIDDFRRIVEFCVEDFRRNK